MNISPKNQCYVLDKTDISIKKIDLFFEWLQSKDAIQWLALKFFSIQPMMIRNCKN